MAQVRKLFVVKQKQIKTLDYPMPKPSADLIEKSLIRVALDGERLIVTMGDTAYRAVFFKHPDEPRLVEASGLAVDERALVYHAEFEEFAWRAANAKARELGWIG